MNTHHCDVCADPEELYGYFRALCTKHSDGWATADELNAAYDTTEFPVCVELAWVNEHPPVRILDTISRRSRNIEVLEHIVEHYTDGLHFVLPNPHLGIERAEAWVRAWVDDDPEEDPIDDDHELLLDLLDTARRHQLTHTLEPDVRRIVERLAHLRYEEAVDAAQRMLRLPCLAEDRGGAVR